MSRIVWRSGLAGLALAAGAALFAGFAAAEEKKEEGFMPLFNGKDLEGWQTQLAGSKGDPKETFQVKDGVIVVSGRPNGYFYTDKGYKNFVLRFDWRYPKKAGNSGCLVYIQPPQKVWPKCVEVQGQYADHGKILGVSGAKIKGTYDQEAYKKAVHPVGEMWNTTEITSKDGMLTNKVNGVQVSSGQGELMEGQIGFQSEGVEINFKNIRIKVEK